MEIPKLVNKTVIEINGEVFINAKLVEIEICGWANKIGSDNDKYRVLMVRILESVMKFNRLVKGAK